MIKGPRWTDRLRDPVIWRPLLGLAVLAVFMLYFRSLTIYAVVALIVTAIGRPLHSRLIRLRWRQLQVGPSVAALITLLVFYLLLLLIISLFVPLLLTELEVLSQIDTARLVEQFRGPLETVEEQLRRYSIDVDLVESSRIWLRESAEHLFGNLQLSDFLNLFTTIGDVLALIFSVSFVSFFLLRDRELLPDIIDLLTPKAAEIRIKRILVGVRPLLRRYFWGIALQITLISTGYFIGFWALGLKHAFLIAFLAGLFNVIPYLGPLIGGALAVGMAFSTSFAGESPAPWAVGAVYLGVQMADNMLMQPVIFSNSVKAHPLEIFFVILMGARLGGVLGMILAVPVYTVIRIVARELYAHNPIVNRLTRHL